MGLDLRLLPFDSPEGCGREFSHTILPLERDWELFDQIREVEEEQGRDIPERFRSFLGRDDQGEYRYGETERTPYGSRLRYVRVKHLLSLQEEPCFCEGYPENRALLAWLQASDPERRIALYWH